MMPTQMRAGLKIWLTSSTASKMTGSLLVRRSVRPVDLGLGESPEVRRKRIEWPARIIVR